MRQVLWVSREAVWTAAPPASPAAPATLDSYFHRPRPEWPTQAVPWWGPLAGLVLASAKSAPQQTVFGAS
eukprot:2308292-Alexandrium_andersonii.AAC.1